MPSTGVRVRATTSLPARIRLGRRVAAAGSMSSMRKHPGWYRNLVREPQVELQVKGEVFPARARTATGEERERLWKLAAEQWPDYDEYRKRTDRKRTDRQIPVVVLERA